MSLLSIGVPQAAEAAGKAEAVAVKAVQLSRTAHTRAALAAAISASQAYNEVHLSSAFLPDNIHVSCRITLGCYTLAAGSQPKFF